MTAAAALPPPTSPYLQALERASSGIVKQQAAAASNLYGYEDESDGCWVCGNATRASQAYCSTACRDSDTLQRSMTADQQQEVLNDDLVLYTGQLQGSPTLSPAVHAVPALVPSGSGRKSRSGTTTPVAPASAARRRSSNRAHPQTSAADQASRRRSNSSSNGDGNISKQHHIITSAGEGSSSSPPSSSATSSPTKTATDDDRIEEDIENLLLPPPIGAPSDKRTAPNGFDYAYPYGIRAGTTVVVPKSPPSAKTQPNRTNVNTTVPTLSSTGMRKSTSQQHNRHSKSQNLMLSPIFAPKSMGATTTSTGGLIHDPSLAFTTRPTSSSSNCITTHDNSNTPPVNPSEVITFRRRHYAADSINGHQKSSHGNGNVSSTTSSNASPALHAAPNPTTSSKTSSRRHSSHGSAITSPKMAPAFSPLVKAKSTTSKSVPALKATDNGAPISPTSTSSPSVRPVDGPVGSSSPSLAASSLSDLLLRTVSRTESIGAQQQSHPSSITGNKRASKSDTVLHDSIPEHGSLTSTKGGLENSKKTWLQRNKLTKTFFSFNNGPSSTLSRIGTAAEEGSSSNYQTHDSCGKKDCFNHPPRHPLASLLSPLSRRVSEPGGAGSPFASPAIYYTDAPYDPFAESFASRSVSDSITATYKHNSLSPSRNGVSKGDYGTLNGSGNTQPRRPSLSTSMTAPPIVEASPSPGLGGVKPQDYSGFAGFLFALHNQRKASAAAAANSSSQQASDLRNSNSAKRPTFELHSTPDSSESGYDAQDEQVSASRGRGRNSNRRPIVERTSFENHGTLFKSEAQGYIGGAQTAKPALLKEKLNNVVKANKEAEGQDHQNNSTSNTSTADVSPARSNTSSNGRPTRFLFSRGNAFKNSNLNESTASNSESTEEVADRSRKVEETQQASRLRDDQPAATGEGSQYIVNLRDQSKGSKKVETEDDSLSEESDNVREARGRPTARRRSSGNGRRPMVSPFTTLERESVEDPKNQPDDGGRGRSRARGSAALHRSVSPARSSSRARGRDSPRLRTR